jgi:hypothetical protein
VLKWETFGKLLSGKEEMFENTETDDGVWSLERCCRRMEKVS